MAGAHRHEATLGARNSALDQQQLACFVNANHVEILGGDGLSPMWPVIFAREHATGDLGPAIETVSWNIVRKRLLPCGGAASGSCDV